MREVRDCAVGGIKTGACSVRVGCVVRQEEVVIETEQAEMAPVAGVEFLPVREKYCSRRSAVRHRREVADVGHALFFVDDQVEYEVQVLGISLCYQPLRRVAVRATVVHVHMNVGTLPLLAPVGWQGQGVHSDSLVSCLICADLDCSFLHLILETTPDRHAGSAGRHPDVSVAVTVEVVRLKRAVATVKAIVCADPCILGCIGQAIRPCYSDARCDWLSVAVQCLDVQLAPRMHVSLLAYLQFPLSATQHVLQPDFGRAASIRDESYA